MKRKIKKFLAAVLVLFAMLLVIICGFIMIKRIINSNTYRIKTENGVQESTYIDVNGIKQYIQIRGEDVDNPVIVFVHGGPANPVSYISSYFQKNVEDVATFVQYDQRGCGRTYYENDCDSDTNVELLLADLDGIVDYVRTRFKKEKVIIMGHSWGTALGSLYVQKYPEKVEAYIGVSQVTNVHENKLSAAEQALETEKIKGTQDEENLCALMEKWNQVTEYNDLSMEDLNEMTVLSGKYIGCDGEIAGMDMFKIGLYSVDMGWRDMKWFMESSNPQKYLSHNRDVMEYFIFQYDINQLSRKYEMPVYYISGEGDYIISQDEAKAYFETIEAPEKEFILLENVGHDMFLDNPELFGSTIRSILEEEQRFSALTAHQKAWIADINGEMRKALDLSAGITENMSKEEREKRLDTLIEKIETEQWNDDQIAYYIRQMISDFGIAHMGFGRPDEYCSEKCDVCYPIIGKWFGDDYYIIGTIPEYQEYLGSRLVAIEGKELSEVLKHYDERYANETYAWLKSCFEGYNDIGFGEADFIYLNIKEDSEKSTACFTFERDGRSSDVEVEGVVIKDNQSPDFVTIYDNMKSLPFAMGVYVESERAPFTYKLDEKNKAFYFQYNQCVDSSMQGEESGYPEFKSFFAEMIQAMKDEEGKYDILVIDLRINGGGSEMLLNQAVSEYGEYLNQYPIKVLIGKNTFSAGVDAIDTILYSFDDVSLYGEETGLAIHNYTGVIENTLPNTGCVLYTTDHQDFSYVIQKRQQDLSRGVMPDVEVPLNYEEYIKGIDSVYLRAVQR